MKEFINSNPDSTEFLEMLGNPGNLNAAQIWALAHVFRTHVEGTARSHNTGIGAEEAKADAAKIMKRSLRVPKLLGVKRSLILKAKELGVRASSDYVGEKK